MEWDSSSERSAATWEQEPVGQRQTASSTVCSAWLPLFDGPLHLVRDSYFLEGGDG
jgi:hypothetical protein